MTDILSDEMIDLFVNAESIGDVAETLKKDNFWINDANELVIPLDLPRPLWMTHSGNNFELFAKKLGLKMGEILDRHRLEAEK